MDAATIPRDLTEVPVFAKSLLAGVVIAALVTPALGAQFWRQWSYPNQRVSTRTFKRLVIRQG